MNIQKKNMFKNKMSLFVVLLCLAAGSPAIAHVQNSTDNANATVVDKLVGGWSYTVEDAPAGCENGLLVIVKEGDHYKVQVQIGDGTILGENVKVNGNTINFDVMVEGGRVAVTLTAKGDTMTGKSTSPEGSYAIKGEKTLSME